MWRPAVAEFTRLDRPDAWIDTVGGPFWPAAPMPVDVNIGAIAHALSNLCRFGGHTKEFYSVAQHSVLCAWQIPTGNPRLQLAALMHDAAEAYVVYLPRPLKGLLPGYKVMEDAVTRAIETRFNLLSPLPDAIRRIDERMLVTEASQLMAGASGAWWARESYPPPYEFQIHPWPPARARDVFLDLFFDLRPDLRG